MSIADPSNCFDVSYFKKATSLNGTLGGNGKSVTLNEIYSVSDVKWKPLSLYQTYQEASNVWAKEYITIDFGKEVAVSAIMVKAEQTGKDESFHYKLFKTSYGEVLVEYMPGKKEKVRNYYSAFQEMPEL